MNNRKRKKWLKKHGKYIPNSELWNLNSTIAEYILPRLKKFRKYNQGCPVIDGINSFKEWQDTLDKMIIAFEYLVTNDDWWIDNPKYDYSSGLHMKFEETDSKNYVRAILDEEDWVKDIKENHDKEQERRDKVIEEGLQLFAKWFRHLWW